MSDCTVLFLPQETLTAFMKRDFRVAENYIRFLSDRLRFLNRRIAGFTGGAADRRLARYLLEHCGGDGAVSLPGSMVELAAALKNVIALSCGVCDGLGYQDNTKALLMTRAMAEITRLGEKLGGSRQTFGGLAGMGDLIVTCGSLHSRNRRAGILIGQGHPPEEAVRLVGTVEGYHAAQAGWELARSLGVEMPITEQCHAVCYEGQPPREAIRRLMERPRRHETETAWESRSGIGL